MPRKTSLPTPSDVPMHGWRPYSDFHLERVRAHAKHDGNGGSMERLTYADSAWLSVVTEEVGEVARVLCEVRHGNYSVPDARDALRSELVQVGAMVAAWVDAIDAEYCGAMREGPLTNPHSEDSSFDRECCLPPGHEEQHLPWSGRERWA